MCMESRDITDGWIMITGGKVRLRREKVVTGDMHEQLSNLSALIMT